MLLGEFRKLTQNLSDDFEFNVVISQKSAENMDSIWPGVSYFEFGPIDIGHADKIITIALGDELCA